MKMKQKKVPKRNAPLSAQKPWYLNRTAVLLILAAVPLLVYIRVVTLGYTMLDDSIFIRENQEFNSHIGNIAASFHRGVFNAEKDSYYRPVFLADFVIESQFFGTSVAAYHFTNLVFHILCVLLLFLFFTRLRMADPPALFLALVFAVHPVLSQAVAWIPGRNDMLLMIFFLGGLVITMDYAGKPGWKAYAGQLLMFLAALFTKETAVMIPLVSLSVLIFILRAPWKRTALLSTGWAAGILLWILVRSMAPLLKQDLSLAQLIENGIRRSPAVLQYLGKIFFPFNLSVFPPVEGIFTGWGILATVLLAGLIIYLGTWKSPLTWTGLLWYLLFLVPVLMVPASMNDQVFEHRLYIPLAGILIMAAPMLERPDRLKLPALIIVASALILVFSAMTFIRTELFRSPLSFWSRAVKDNPRSSYANMMLGLRMSDTNDMIRYFGEAYKLNPDEKMLNYFIGKIALDRGNPEVAKSHLLRELRHPGIPDNYFLLARIYFNDNKPDSAAWYLRELILLDPLHPQANHNLGLLYFQMNMKKEAAEVIASMRSKGMAVPADLENLAASSK